MRQQQPLLALLLLAASLPSSALETGYRCTGDVHSALVKTPSSRPLPANVAIAACVSALSELLRDDFGKRRGAATVDFGYLGGSFDELVWDDDGTVALPGDEADKLIWEAEADDFKLIWEEESGDFLVQPLPFETAIVVGEGVSPGGDDGEAASLDGLAVNVAGLTEYNPTMPPGPKVDPYNPTRPPGPDVDPYNPTRPPGSKVDHYNPTMPPGPYNPTRPVDPYNPTRPPGPYNPTRPVDPLNRSL